MDAESPLVVICVVRLHRANDAQFVDDVAHVRKKIADRGAALAARAESPLRRLEIALEVPELPLPIVDRDRFAVIANEPRLRVERVDVRDAAGHVQKDHAFGPRLKVRSLGGQGIVRQSRPRRRGWPADRQEFRPARSTQNRRPAVGTAPDATIRFRDRPSAFLPSVDKQKFVARKEGPAKAAQDIRSRSPTETPPRPAHADSPRGTRGSFLLWHGRSDGRAFSKCTRQSPCFVRRCGDQPGRQKRHDCACTNGSFIRNRDCVGTVVESRWAVLTLPSGPSNSPRKGCRRIARHQIDAAVVGS